jgi:hypothetical protein
VADGDPVQGPLQGFRGRVGAGVNHAKPWLPELNIVVGRDTESSGLTINVWEDTGGQYPRFRTLYSARWNAPIGSTREAMEIATHGLAAALAELFPPED